MKTELLCQPASTVARLTLAAGESVTCEVGAMIAMSDGLTVNTTSRSRGGGGLMQGMRRVFSGESFFLNHFHADRDGAHLIIGPSMLGDIVHHRLSGGTVVVQGSSWLASGPGIEIDTTFQGLGKALLSGESVFWVKCTGQGDLLLNSFGAIYAMDIDGEYIVDTGHIVAFEDTLSFAMTKASESLIGSLLGGEGFVCRFKGRGRLWCQSHNPPAFGAELGPMLLPR
jgi:uncharacterized protein (TIGR00266 family)